MHEKIDYPIFFEDIFVNKVWAANNFSKIFKNRKFAHNVGESWELSCFNENISVVSNGKFKGEKITDVLKDTNILKNIFLVKLIDSGDFLSVQVHPDNEYKKKFGDCNVKNEMWYIINALENSCLYIGTNIKTKTEIKKSIDNNTLCDHLKKFYPKKGEVYIIPAGTIHAIGPGITLYEIQQTSSTTFRIFDWNRKPARELHIKESKNAVRVNNNKFKIRSDIIIKKNIKIEKFIFSNYFKMISISGTGSLNINFNNYISLTSIKNNIIINFKNGSEKCCESRTCFVHSDCKNINLSFTRSEFIICLNYSENINID